jgi:hypothetical protein
MSGILPNRVLCIDVGLAAPSLHDNGAKVNLLPIGIHRPTVKVLTGDRTRVLRQIRTSANLDRLRHVLDSATAAIRPHRCRKAGTVVGVR